MVNPDRNLYDPPYDDALLYDNEMEPERPRSRPLIVLLGFVVLAAFAGVVWVAYNQGVQQGQRGTNPPVLSADSGPTRVEPDQVASSPSANPAPEKSYERLWATNEPSSGQENVLPSPEQPRAIPSTQDVASAARNGVVIGSSGGPLDATPPVDPRMDATTGGEPAPAMTAPSLARPNSRMREDITEMLPGPDSDIASEPPLSAPRSIATAPSVSRPTVTQTPPAARPITQSQVTSLAPIAPAPPPTQLQSNTPIEAAPVETVAVASAGKVSIQLGSFPSSGLAAAQWSKVKGANQDLLGSYSPQIVEAKIEGKGVWYRLRVGGFADKSSAKLVCDQLQASGQACIIPGK